jgi:hypothetical protein
MRPVGDLEGTLGANRSKTSGKGESGVVLPSVLVLAVPSSETDDLLATLIARSDLCILRVAGLNAAEIALRDVAVSLVIACPETEAAAVTSVIDLAGRLRPGTPVLALRSRSDELAPSWKGPTVGVLHGPILPAVLSRTVDVALGLGQPAAPKGR